MPGCRFIFNIVTAIYNMATYYPAIWKCINPYWCVGPTVVPELIFSCAACFGNEASFKICKKSCFKDADLCIASPAKKAVDGVQGLLVLHQQWRVWLDEVTASAIIARTPCPACQLCRALILVAPGSAPRKKCHVALTTRPAHAAACRASSWRSPARRRRTLISATSRARRFR